MSGTIEQRIWDVMRATGGAAMWSLQRELPFEAKSIRDAVTRMCRRRCVVVGRAERRGHHHVNVYLAVGERPGDGRGVSRRAA